MRGLLAIGGAVLAGGTALFAFGPRAAPSEPAALPTVVAVPAIPAAAPAVAPLPAAAAPGAAVADDTTIQLPDGSRIAALNGARSPRPLAEAWPIGVPWSPIVGTEHSPAGIDWYVHADGSRSTTEMAWRADLGRFDAMTRLARPAPKSQPAPPRR